MEEVKEKCNGIELQNEDVYMATTYDDFVKAVVLRGRGVGLEEFTYTPVSMQHLNRNNPSRDVHELCFAIARSRSTNFLVA